MKYYVVDVFTDTLFGGNLAGVCLLDIWINETLMQRITFENNLSETVFSCEAGREYDLRWFTPEIEMDLCGHATLGSAYILMTVRKLTPDFSLLKGIEKPFAIIVTARGEDCDFVSRFFAPGAGINEDPVTGSAHCTLIPFWSERLGKTEMLARQLSRRGGKIFCRDCGDRVKIGGEVRLYLAGEIMNEGQ